MMVVNAQPLVAGHDNCLQMARDSVTDSEHLREVDPDVDDGLHLHLALDPGVAADCCPVVDVEADVVPHSDPVPEVAAEHRLGVDPAVDVDLHPVRIPDAAAADEDHRAGTWDAACRS